MSLTSRNWGPVYEMVSFEGMTNWMILTKRDVKGRKRRVFVTLNRVWAFASCRAISPEVIITALLKRGRISRNITTPMTLNSTCAAAACLALLLDPIHAITAVMVVPMLSPRRMGIAASRPKSPWVAMAMVRPTVAELDCTSMVRPAPAITPRSGLWLKARNISCLPLRNSMESPMYCIPRKRRPKPTSPFPRYFCFLVLPKTESIIPTAIMGSA